MRNSDTPFRDVVDLGTAIGQAKGLDAANAELAGLISLGLFFPRRTGNRNMGIHWNSCERKSAERVYPKIRMVEENGAAI